MEAFEGIVGGLATVLTLTYLLYALVGTLLGTAVGVLPGLGPSVTMALLLPVVFALGDPIGAIIMFAGIYYGAMYGGSTTSILLSTPGESSSAVTILDGYQMTRAGRGGAALLSAAVGSFVAGVIGTFALALVARPLISVALAFGPAEYFALTLLALSTASMLGGHPWKGAWSVLLGLAIGTIGIHASSGSERFTYGVIQLLNGVDFEIAAIGLFAIAEVVFVLGNLRTGRWVQTPVVGKLLMTREEWRRSIAPWLRGSVLGFVSGSLPGTGTTVASYLSYSLERSVSKTPKKFGTGMIEGLAGPEAANNSASAGSMVPLLALGIPGSAATAVMLGALQGFGVPTGPLLLDTNPDLVWAVIASLLVGNVMLLVLNVPLVGLWVRLLHTPGALLYPMILVISLIGVFSLARSQVDLYLLTAFGVLGFILRYARMPLAPAILAVVLGPLVEKQWGNALLGSNGDWTVFIRSPIAAGFLILTVALLATPRIIRVARRRARTAASAENG